MATGQQGNRATRPQHSAGRDHFKCAISRPHRQLSVAVNFRGSLAASFFLARALRSRHRGMETTSPVAGSMAGGGLVQRGKGNHWHGERGRLARVWRHADRCFRRQIPKDSTALLHRQRQDNDRDARLGCSQTSFSSQGSTASSISRSASACAVSPRRKGSGISVFVQCPSRKVLPRAV